jgi:protein-S-isoprenylcysteine O-methyltransferase Ste14
MTFYDYFQIAAVLCFALTILIKTLYLWSRGVNPIAIGGGKKGLVLILEIISFSSLFVWMVEIVLYALHCSFHIFPSPLDTQILDSPEARIVGVVLTCIGFAIFSIAYLSFGDSWRIGFDIKRPGTLVTSGIFAFTRNPIYLSLDLWFTGVFLITGALIFLIFAILAFLAQHWQILQEEAFLTNLYGQPYRDYRRRIGRYFGKR